MTDTTSGSATAAPVTADAPQTTAPPTIASGYSWYVLVVLVIVYILNFIDRQIVSILAVVSHLSPGLGVLLLLCLPLLFLLTRYFQRRIELTGVKLRRMMPWLNPREVKPGAGGA